MPAAPLELVMIGFPGRPFSAEIIPAAKASSIAARCASSTSSW